MTIRQLIYRMLYLQTPGWKITRWLRLRGHCHRCGTSQRLHLHHENYPFFAVWYRLFLLAIGVWIFHEAGMWMMFMLMVMPDLISRMKTLCAAHHSMEHGR